MLAREGLPWNSLRADALRSDSHGKSEHEACVSFGTHAPFTRCASRHAQKGTQPPDTGHRCARPPTRALRAALQAERSDGPSGSPIPSVRAEKRRAAGACVCRRTHALRALTRRSCLNGAHAVRAVSSAAAPADRASQVAPQRSGGDAHSRVAFLLGPFLWRSKEKDLARRGETRPREANSPPAQNVRPHQKTSSPQCVAGLVLSVALSLPIAAVDLARHRICRHHRAMAQPAHSIASKAPPCSTRATRAGA